MNSVGAHRQAEMLTAQAEELVSQGLQEEASSLYLRAAAEEAQAFEHIPVARSRTRGIIAVSTVVLYRRAQALGEAIRHAHGYLALGDLPDFAREQLEELLIEAVQEQRLLGSGRSQAPGVMRTPPKD
jgi:hypothetical protein